MFYHDLIAQEFKSIYCFVYDYIRTCYAHVVISCTATQLTDFRRSNPTTSGMDVKSYNHFRSHLTQNLWCNRDYFSTDTYIIIIVIILIIVAGNK